MDQRGFPCRDLPAGDVDVVPVVVVGREPGDGLAVDEGVEFVAQVDYEEVVSGVFSCMRLRVDSENCSLPARPRPARPVRVGPVRVGVGLGVGLGLTSGPSWLNVLRSSVVRYMVSTEVSWTRVEGCWLGIL